MRRLLALAAALTALLGGSASAAPFTPKLEAAATVSALPYEGPILRGWRTRHANEVLVTKLCNPAEYCVATSSGPCWRVGLLKISCKAGLYYSIPDRTCEWVNPWYLEPRDPTLYLDLAGIKSCPAPG